MSPGIVIGARLPSVKEDKFPALSLHSGRLLLLKSLFYPKDFGFCLGGQWLSTSYCYPLVCYIHFGGFFSDNLLSFIIFIILIILSKYLFWLYVY